MIASTIADKLLMGSPYIIRPQDRRESFNNILEGSF
jgi:hypothetical protein